MIARYVGVGLAAGVAALIMGTPAQAAPGQRVAFVRGGSVYVHSGTTQTRLTRGTDDTRPRWSPDGTRIAFGHGGRLWGMNADRTRRQAGARGAPGRAPRAPGRRRRGPAPPGCPR